MRNTLKRLMTTGALIGAATAVTPASAAEFTFLFDGTEFDIWGTLTTEDTPDGDGGYLITGISGWYGTEAITGLSVPGSTGFNDNLLFVGGDPLLDGLGFTFEAAGEEHNIYYSSFADSYREYFVQYGDFSISPVPEASTWAMMILGLGFAGAAMRTRKNTKVSVSYA